LTGQAKKMNNKYGILLERQNLSGSPPKAVVFFDNKGKLNE
jgi:hypothetical protein